jgi:UrcA family protein
MAPAAAHAAPVNATDFDAPVAHGDLDLSAPGDVTRLDERVRTKVRQLCQNGGRDSASLRLERECRDSALAATAPAVRIAIANARRDQFWLADADPASPAATPGA